MVLMRWQSTVYCMGMSARGSIRECEGLIARSLALKPWQPYSPLAQLWGTYQNLKSLYIGLNQRDGSYVYIGWNPSGLNCSVVLGSEGWIIPLVGMLGIYTV